jgi:hypothetical protein
MREAAAARQ